MRDQFICELTKIRHSKSGDAADQTSKWQYFKQLHFLRNVVKARNLKHCQKNLDPSLSYTKNANHQYTKDKQRCEESEEDTYSQHIEEGLENPITTDEGRNSVLVGDVESLNSTKNNEKNRERSVEECMAPIIEIEKRKMDVINQNITNMKRYESDDEDLLFFKSLLPHVKKIPAENKLTFRGKLQEVVQQFAYR